MDWKQENTILKDAIEVFGEALRIKMAKLVRLEALIKEKRYKK